MHEWQSGFPTKECRVLVTKISDGKYIEPFIAEFKDKRFYFNNISFYGESDGVLWQELPSVPNISKNLVDWLNSQGIFEWYLRSMTAISGRSFIVINGDDVGKSFPVYLTVHQVMSKIRHRCISPTAYFLEIFDLEKDCKLVWEDLVVVKDPQANSTPNVQLTTPPKKWLGQDDECWPPLKNPYVPEGFSIADR